MNKRIFREYDIRGVASRDLTTDLALALGVGDFKGPPVRASAEAFHDLAVEIEIDVHVHLNGLDALFLEDGVRLLH